MRRQVSAWVLAAWPRLPLPRTGTRWSGTAARNRPSVREPEHQVLARPRDRRVEQAGDADPVWQSAFDGGLDATRREEGQRDRHVDVALAAGLPCRDAVECRSAGLDLEQ